MALTNDEFPKYNREEAPLSEVNLPVWAEYHWGQWDELYKDICTEYINGPMSSEQIHAFAVVVSNKLEKKRLKKQKIRKAIKFKLGDTAVRNGDLVTAERVIADPDLSTEAHTLLGARFIQAESEARAAISELSPSDFNE